MGFPLVRDRVDGLRCRLKPSGFRTTPGMGTRECALRLWVWRAHGTWYVQAGRAGRGEEFSSQPFGWVPYLLTGNVRVAYIHLHVINSSARRGHTPRFNQHPVLRAALPCIYKDHFPRNRLSEESIAPLAHENCEKRARRSACRRSIPAAHQPSTLHESLDSTDLCATPGELNTRNTFRDPGAHRVTVGCATERKS
jgi:hypothetical protein